MSTFERSAENGGGPDGFAETYSIDTPEQVGLEFQIAGLGSRFVAILLDSLITGAMYFFLFVIVIVAMPGIYQDGKFDGAGVWFLAAIILVVFLIMWGYFALFEAYWHGQTPGKKAMSLRVIKDSGRQITLFESLARNLLRAIDYLPGMYLIGVITMMCNKRNKRLGDLVAGTLVVHERSEEQPLILQGAMNLTPSAAEPWRQAVPAMFAADAVARLEPQDLVIIETFFHRMLDLPLETRAALAYRIAGQMAAKMGVVLAPETNPERAMESMAYQMRGGRG